jgi:amino acid transporter
MKKWIVAFFFFLMLALANNSANAQCSICTKTAQQMGEKPATGLNAGIMYLAAMPFLIFSYIGYRWVKANRPISD